jgi:hypothetical protein
LWSCGVRYSHVFALADSNWSIYHVPAGIEIGKREPVEFPFLKKFEITQHGLSGIRGSNQQRSVIFTSPSDSLDTVPHNKCITKVYENDILRDIGIFKSYSTNEAYVTYTRNKSAVIKIFSAGYNLFASDVCVLFG